MKETSERQKLFYYVTFPAFSLQLQYTPNLGFIEVDKQFDINTKANKGSRLIQAQSK